MWMPPLIRDAQPSDFARLEELLTANSMLNCPEIDGKEAMARIITHPGNVYLVAEQHGRVIGLIRAAYDGSRAIIHQMAVDPEIQRQGIGKLLMHALVGRLKGLGAPSVSVTATPSSSPYYAQLGFKSVQIELLVASDINKVLSRTKTADPCGHHKP
jgi:N-acetylglutamate synthase-like GNAT family acetyltransferase